MRHGEIDDEEVPEGYYDPALDVDASGYWTFDEPQDEMHDAAELHHPELQDEGDA